MVIRHKKICNSLGLLLGLQTLNSSKHKALIIKSSNKELFLWKTIENNDIEMTQAICPPTQDKATGFTQ